MINVDWLGVRVSLIPNGLGLVNHFENPPANGKQGLDAVVNKKQEKFVNYTPITKKQRGVRFNREKYIDFYKFEKEHGKIFKFSRGGFLA
jgi:hypothetical protein